MQSSLYNSKTNLQDTFCLDFPTHLGCGIRSSRMDPGVRRGPAENSQRNVAGCNLYGLAIKARRAKPGWESSSENLSRLYLRAQKRYKKSAPFSYYRDAKLSTYFQQVPESDCKVLKARLRSTAHPATQPSARLTGLALLQLLGIRPLSMDRAGKRGEMQLMLGEVPGTATSNRT